MSPAFWFFWLLGLAISSILGAVVVRWYRPYGYMILATMLAIYIVAANVLVPRLTTFTIFGWPFILVTGSIIWPYTSQLSDMINEIYGRRSAYLAAAVAYLANTMFIIFLAMAFQTPPLDPNAETYFRTYFGIAWRVLGASFVTYVITNYVDITIFSWFKRWSAKQELSAGKMYAYSALRSGVSDGLQMTLDSLIFYTLAFIGTMPGDVLIGLIVSSTIAKVLLSQVDLPFFLLFKYMTKGVHREDIPLEDEPKARMEVRPGDI